MYTPRSTETNIDVHTRYKHTAEVQHRRTHNTPMRTHAQTYQHNKHINGPFLASHSLACAFGLPLSFFPSLPHKYQLTQIQNDDCCFICCFNVLLPFYFLFLSFSLSECLLCKTFLSSIKWSEAEALVFKTCLNVRQDNNHSKFNCLRCSRNNSTLFSNWLGLFILISIYYDDDESYWKRHNIISQSLIKPEHLIPS